MHKVIVIGAGTAGCIVAARLLENPNNAVLLVEEGPDQNLNNGPLSSLDFSDILGDASRFYTDLSATKVETASPLPYLRGRGIGGSAAVNAMLALPGLPGDYNRWASELGCSDWSWERVRPWFDKLKSDLTVSDRSSANSISLALFGAAADLGIRDDIDTFTPENGAGFLWRNANEQGRFSSYERYLLPVRGHKNLSIRSDSRVLSLIFKQETVVGVRLESGEEIPADDVIVCAGVFETPALLLRSGLPHPGIGKNLQDHPAVCLNLSLHPEYRDIDRPGRPAIDAVLRLSSSRGYGDIHLLPCQGGLYSEVTGVDGAISAGLMTVTSVGEVALNPDNPSGRPVVTERMLSTAEDLQAMTEAVSYALQVLETPSFKRIIKDVFIDSVGTPLSVLQGASDFQDWLMGSVGDYFHACGTARMGPREDPNAVVAEDGQVHGIRNLRVIDASIMPAVPSANTHLPTAMIAERLSAKMNDVLREQNK